MSTARNIPNDRGLTLRMFTTGLMIVLLYGAVIGLLIAVGISYAAVLVIAGALLFCQYWFSDKIALYGMGGRIVTAEQAPQLHGAIDRLCAMADMKKPRVAVADTDVPNAFATGRSPNERGGVRHHRAHAPPRRARAGGRPGPRALPRGPPGRGRDDHRQLPRHAGRSRDPDDALDGDDGRVRRRHGRRSGGNNNQGGDNAAMVELAILVVSVVVYAISFLLTMALSRYRELAADRSGALLTGQPSVLASALVKVTGDIARIPTRDLRSTETFNAFYFTPAVAKSGVSISTLFSTHPSLDQRLAQLAALEAEMGRPS